MKPMLRPGFIVARPVRAGAVLGAVAVAVAAYLAPSSLHGAEPTSPAGAPATAAATVPSVIVVVGVAGEEEFGESFLHQSAKWQEAATRAGARHQVIGVAPVGPIADRDLLKRALEAEAKEGTAELWLVLIGHGTFDGRDGKFNLRGDDISGTELSDLLKPFRRPLAVLNTASSSAPFINRLSGPNRVVVTATRSGAEQNYTRFGNYLADAIAGEDGDVDKDGETSLLEAFLSGSAKMAEWYKTEGRLATEHPLLDDTGDSLGTPPDWFKGVRAIKKAQNNAAPDGVRAHQFSLIRSAAEQQLSPEIRQRRDEIEREVARLRDLKPRLAENEYFHRLEELMLELAKLYAPGS